MGTRTNTLLASVASVVLILSGNLWQPTPRDFHGPVGGPTSLSWLWSQDNKTVVAAADKDAEDADSDKKDAAEGKDDQDGKLKELWDSPMLG